MPAAKSSLSLPATVTRPVLVGCLNCRWLPRVAAKIQPSSASIRRTVLILIVGMAASTVVPSPNRPIGLRKGYENICAPPLTPCTQSRTFPFMKTLSSTELRANLSAVMDRVNDDHEPVIVHRAKGKPVVMVSLEDWASMDETTYLTSSPANKAALDEAIRSLNAGEPTIVKTMEELEAMARD